MSMTINIFVLFLTFNSCRRTTARILDELLERIEAIEKREQVHTSRIELLETEVENLNEANAMLRQDLTDTTSKLRDKTNIIDELKQRADIQQEAFRNLQTEVTLLKQSYGILMTLTDSANGESKQEELSSNNEHDEDSDENVEDLFKTDARFNYTKVAKNDLSNYQTVSHPEKASTHQIRGARSNKRSGLTRQGKQLSESVAFHAVVTPNVVEHLGTYQNIKFDHVLLNLGNSYHNQHGLFIAPRPGLYMFSVSITTTSIHFWASLVRNGQRLAGIIGPDDKTYIQGSVTVLTQLVQGDEVWVIHTNPADGSIWGNYYTSFCGILLVEA